MIYTDGMATFEYKAPQPRKYAYLKRMPSGNTVRVYRASNIRFVGKAFTGGKHFMVDMSNLDVRGFMRGGSSAPRLMKEHIEDIGTVEKMSFTPVDKIGGKFSFDFSFTDKQTEQEWIDGRISGFSFHVMASKRRFMNGAITLTGETSLGEITLTRTPAYENAYLKQGVSTRLHNKVDDFMEALAVEN